MQKVSRLAVAAVAAVVLALLSGLASAQSPIKQMKLTEKQVESFITAHKEVAAVVSKMQPDKVDPAIEKELESIAKKYGFKDFDEYDDVAANLALVLTGIDPQTKAFTDPPTAIKKQIEETTADKSLSDKERKQFLDDLADALKMAQPIMHPSNIELVKKYYDKLEPLLQ
jgi:ribonucleotide monophosphatase NagD (HAD superfamily)